MKTIGLLGGISWESTAVYYKLLNEMINERLGGLEAAKCVLHSFNFAEIAALQEAGEWGRLAEMLSEAARGLERSGADFLVISANTMHKVADEVQAAVSIPLVHIGDATGQAIRAQGLRTVGLIGTRYTMEMPFLKEHLARQGFEVLVPDGEEQEVVHRVIFEELVKGKILDASRVKYQMVIRNLVERGAEGVILGCTEIPLLIGPEHAEVPLFDTTTLHAKMAVEWALKP